MYGLPQTRQVSFGARLVQGAKYGVKKKKSNISMQKGQADKHRGGGGSFMTPDSCKYNVIGATRLLLGRKASNALEVPTSENLQPGNTIHTE